MPVDTSELSRLTHQDLHHRLLGKYGRNRTNVWSYPGVKTTSKQGEEGNLLALHPTVKPIALVADALLDFSARGEIVLDSFLGSGTTLLAAERVGRVCCGMEIDPLLCRSGDPALAAHHRRERNSRRNQSFV